MAPAAKRSRGVVVEISSSSEEEGESETDSTGGEDDDDTDEEVSGASSSEIESSGSSDVEEDDDADYIADDDDEEGDELDEKDEESEEEEEEDDRGKRTNIKFGDKNKPTAIRNEGDAYDNIVNLLQRGKNLEGLKHEECKSYLRKHNLRISGTKAICIQRIQEHWRIKDGKGENFYPRSSFTINCTGDVCKGDVVLFKQKVFEKFDKVTRGGGANVIGKRTIAGRIVKESYGATKQQHTFTVEILWSKGVRALPALFPLLVKGRNLYRLKTFRQPWKKENERVKVLHEKHKRGAAARQARAAAKARSGMNKGPKSKGNASSFRPAKQRKKNPKPSKADARKEQHNKHNTNKIQSARASIRISEPCEAPELSRTYYLRPNAQPTGYHGSFASNHQNFAPNDPRQTSHFQSFSGGQTSFQTSFHAVDGFRRDPWRPYRQQAVGFQPRPPVSSTTFPVRMVNMRACSFHGCQELATPGCVVSSCWRCCRITGRSCCQHR